MATTPNAAKAAVVAEVAAKFAAADAALVTEYRGMSVGSLAKLRRSLTVHGAEYKVYKNTLARFGATQAGFEGLNDMPAASPAIRAQIQAEAERAGWPALHAQLKILDPVTAARLAPADSQRISRALEVYRISGQALSSFQLKNITSETTNNQALNASNVPLLSLEPTDRAWLHQRIEQRFDDMLAQGFLEEVKTLRARGDLQIDLPSMRCVGYRQAWEALDGTLPMAELRDRGVFATRQLAKRQLTWLRSMTERSVLQADGPDVLPKALNWVDVQLG